MGADLGFGSPDRKKRLPEDVPPPRPWDYPFRPQSVPPQSPATNWDVVNEPILGPERIVEGYADSLEPSRDKWELELDEVKRQAALVNSEGVELATARLIEELKNEPEGLSDVAVGELTRSVHATNGTPQGALLMKSMRALEVFRLTRSKRSIRTKSAGDNDVWMRMIDDIQTSTERGQPREANEAGTELVKFVKEHPDQRDAVTRRLKAMQLEAKSTLEKSLWQMPIRGIENALPAPAPKVEVEDRELRGPSEPRD